MNVKKEDKTSAMWRQSLFRLKSWSKMRFCVVSCFFLVILSMAIFGKAHSASLQSQKQRVASSICEDFSWVESIVTKYPELQWFESETLFDGSQEVVDEHQFSNHIFKKPVPEFDCAIMSIYCMNTLLNGKYEDYLEYVSHQSRSSELKWQSFVALQNRLHEILAQYPEADKASLHDLFESCIVFNELFKCGVIEKRLNDELKSGVCALEEAFSQIKDVYPSYYQLSPSNQVIFNKIAKMRYFDHIIRLEGGAEMYTPLKQSNILIEDPLLFEMGFFVYECGLAGALGHVNHKSSLIYTEDLYQCLSAVKNSCYLLKDQNEQAAYNHYLHHRAAWLGLDVGSPLHLVLTRIGAMLMLYRPEEGKILKESILKLSAEDLALVVEEFNMVRKDMRGKVPSCLPSVLVNLSNNVCLGDLQKERLEQTIQIGLPFLAKVLRFQKEAHHKKEMNMNASLNFDEVAKVAKEEPKRLQEATFDVDGEGVVQVHQMAN